MTRECGSAVCVVLIAVASFQSPATAQNGVPPPALDGPGSLPLLAQATRAHLLGLVDLYTIALYAKPPFDRAEMLSADRAKALRIEVTYEPDWHRPALVDWQRELVPRFEPPAVVAHLRGTFAGLRRGDIVLIDYAPGRGTSVRVNSSIAVPSAHHELMLAFLDHWLGQRPVSEEIKQRLLASP